MGSLVHLQRGLKDSLARLVGRAQNHLLICSPFVGRAGTDLIAANLTPQLRDRGQLSFVTDLSPLNICRLSTDPAAIASLGGSIRDTTLRHLPRVHAKIYVADAELAIVTSANLTAGGLFRNYEYGVELSDSALVARVQEDVLEYAELGALVRRHELEAYCLAVDRLRTVFEHQRSSASASIKRQFQENLRVVEDDLIRLRLAGGAVHTVFAKTILYLLRRNGPMRTRDLHPLVASIHPDLCDDTVDRIIDGKRFGKKWKHAVRTAQQQLKKRGSIEYDGNVWKPQQQ